MKKFLSLSLTALVMLISCNKDKPNTVKDEFDIIKENAAVNIGVQTDAPPMNYLTDDKKVTGLDYEIAKLIFAQEEFGISKVNMQHDAITFEEILPLLKKKSKDGKHTTDLVMGGLTYEEEENGIVFTDPYMEDFGYCLVSKNSDAIKTLDDLKGKKIGVVRGDSDVMDFVVNNIKKNYPDVNIVELDDEQDDWMQYYADRNEVDAFIYDFPFAATELQNNPEGTLTIKLSNLKGSNLQYRIGVRKGNKLLLENLNKAIAKVKKLPEYAQKLRDFLPTQKVAKVENTGNNPTHTVAVGETLSKIAQEKLGNIDEWKELQDLNNIPNPNLIQVGQVLILPKK